MFISCRRRYNFHGLSESLDAKQLASPGTTVNSWHLSLDCLVPSSWFFLLIKLLSCSLSPQKESNKGQGHNASILGYMCESC